MFHECKNDVSHSAVVVVRKCVFALSVCVLVFWMFQKFCLPKCCQQRDIRGLNFQAFHENRH